MSTVRAQAGAADSMHAPSRRSGRRVYLLELLCHRRLLLRRWRRGAWWTCACCGRLRHRTLTSPGRLCFVESDVRPLVPVESSLDNGGKFAPIPVSPRSVRERGAVAAGRPHGARSRPPGASSCPPHPAARFRHCKHPCFPPPSPSRSPPSRRSQRSALDASVGPAAAAQDAPNPTIEV